MANHCDNDVEITNCNPDTVEKIKAIFEKLMKPIDSYEEVPYFAELMAVEGVEQSSLFHKFGTKWIDLYHLDICKNTIIVSATTAWRPFDGLCEMIARMFPEITLELKYSEGGCDFGGCDKYYHDNNGEFVKECVEMSYLEFKKEYDYEGFENELIDTLDNSFDNDKELMIADEYYAPFAEDIKALDID